MGTKEMTSKAVGHKRANFKKLPPEAPAEKDGLKGDVMKAAQRAGMVNSTGKGTTGAVGD